MSANPESEWPPYRAGHSEHYLALGVITSLFNDLEFQLFGIFFRALRLKVDIAQHVFVLLSNQERIDLTRQAMETEQDLDLKNLVSHFLECYSTIADNRNFLAHSNLYGADSDSEHAVFGKGSRRQPSSVAFLKITVSDLRRVADEIQELCSYCARVDQWFAAKHGLIRTGDGHRLPAIVLPLPNKSPAPVRLRATPRVSEK